MKTRIFLFCLFSGIIYFSCEDNVDSVGMGMLPGGDNIFVSYDTVNQLADINASTKLFKSVSASSRVGFLGSFYDPRYGNIKSDYVCQYYPSISFSIPDSYRLVSIDSVRLDLLYTSYFGDSLVPMEVSVYPLNKDLGSDFSTDTDPSTYYDKKDLWAKKAYTAYDLNVPDSIRNLSTYYTNVELNLPIEIGEKLYAEYEKNDSLFRTLDGFLSLFPGTYIESSFGTGNLLYVDINNLMVHYVRESLSVIDTVTHSLRRDTLIAVFTSTSEVYQFNHITNTVNEELLNTDNDKMYILTPAGVHPEINLSIAKIIEKVGRKKFNSVKLNVKADVDGLERKLYDLPIPAQGNTIKDRSSCLLLIESDSVDVFFREQRRIDSQGAYISTYDSVSQSYNFPNIANLIQKAIDNNTSMLKISLVPALIEYRQEMASYYVASHYFFPSAVALKKKEGDLEITIIASDLGKND